MLLYVKINIATTWRTYFRNYFYRKPSHRRELAISIEGAALERFKSQNGVMRPGLIFAAFIFISILSTGSLAQPARLNVELRQLIIAAANTSDAGEMDSLLSDDYTQADVSDKGNSLTTKARIVRQLAEVPEAFKPLMERVSTRSELANLRSVHNGECAVFTADLVARSIVRVSDRLPAKTVTQVERFEISGSAVRVDGRWKLSSLRRSRTMAKDVAVRMEELEGNKAFDVAVVGLLLEGAARAKAANPPDFY